MPSVKAKCRSCDGSGLYRGMCEAPGTAVVCLTCEGKGWATIKYEEFTGRRRVAGVHTIQQSRGTFIASGVGGHGPTMTYEEFERRFPS